jgi:hypothetical protein
MATLLGQESGETYVKFRKLDFIGIVSGSFIRSLPVIWSSYKLLPTIPRV